MCLFTFSETEKNRAPWSPITVQSFDYPAEATVLTAPAISPVFLMRSGM
jgi:hypothetical protein